MINQLFIMDGYGVYVWSAFLFTMLSFISLYLLIKKQLVREQAIFVSKFLNLSEKKLEAVKAKKINKEILVSSPNFNF
jgi:heme exporter protein D